MLISFTVAKEYVLNLMIKGLRLSEPCDESFSDEDFKLPEWFNEDKFKRWVLTETCIDSLTYYFLPHPSGVKNISRTTDPALCCQIFTDCSRWSVSQTVQLFLTGLECQVPHKQLRSDTSRQHYTWWAGFKMNWSRDQSKNHCVLIEPALTQ